MVDVLLTGGEQLPSECNDCLKRFIPTAKTPVDQVFCTNGNDGLAMLVSTTIMVYAEVRVRVTGTTEPLFCPRCR